MEGKLTTKNNGREIEKKIMEGKLKKKNGRETKKKNNGREINKNQKKKWKSCLEMKENVFDVVY